MEYVPHVHSTGCDFKSFVWRRSSCVYTFDYVLQICMHKYIQIILEVLGIYFYVQEHC